MKRSDAAGIAWGLLSLALLLGAGVDRLSVRPPADAADYHRHVREAAAKIPLQIGGWEGTDVPVAYDAARMLRPNVMICRDYQQAQSGQEFWFLLVQCDDALALGGHYPPNCYPSIGYVQQSQQSKIWHSGSMTINGCEYVFARSEKDSDPPLTIENFLLLPDGGSTSDMNAVFIAASDLRSRFYGGAEVQLVFDSSMDAEKRQEIVREVLSAAHDTLAAIASKNGTIAANVTGALKVSHFQ